MSSHRAASNAYSWWWASHVRTKQSKWLDQSLQDMEDKVEYVLKMIGEDGDSFATRAEMYYKKRPELISFVEDSYRAFRALAERYDHLSKDLQKVNNTLATVCPQQFQLTMSMDDDDDLPPPNPKLARNLPQSPPAASKQYETQGLGLGLECAPPPTKPKSGLTKDEALEEIDKLQKEILALQTVKEFVRTSYETGLSRYWEIESQLMEKQQKLCTLQEEFSLNKIIQDDEARSLMAAAALKSCQQTLSQLQEKQEKYNHEARGEYKRIEQARQKLESIRQEFLKDEADEQNEVDNAKDEPSHSSQEHFDDDVEGDRETTKKKPIEENAEEEGSSAPLTVKQLADKIDELVNKVINLETSVSSQTLLIDRLRTEADDLHTQIHVLEEDKANLVDDTQQLRIRVQKLEGKLNGIQHLNGQVESQNYDLQTHFAQACSTLDNLSEKLSNVKPDANEDEFVREKVVQLQQAEIHMQPKMIEEEIKEEDPGTPAKKTDQFRDPITKVILDDDEESLSSESEFDWQKMVLSAMEDKEKVLLKEYTMILRSYKEAKQKLDEMEKKEKDHQFDIMLQMRELKSAVSKRDEEIQRLRQRFEELLPQLPSEPAEEEYQVLDSTGRENKHEAASPSPSPSPIEEMLRQEIDAILDENLNFWLRFSTSYNQIGKFRTSVQDLQNETAKLKEKKKKSSSSKKQEEGEVLKCDARAIYKHLKEIQAELTVWAEQSRVLTKEVDRRFSSLCSIQEKMTIALKEEAEEEEIRFSSHHQAAKFQGEILNMKQENNKVRDELRTAVDHITTLHFEIDKTLRKLNDDFQLSEDPPQKLSHPVSGSRPRIPLRSFIFGTMQKKHRHSIFSYMHHSRKYQAPKQ